MPRHEHEVRVQVRAGLTVGLKCRCGWTSGWYADPTVSLLAQHAQDHRRAARR